jgi:hypothetical protein
VARMASAHVIVTRVDMRKFQPRERPVAAKTRIQQLQDALRLLELEVAKDHGLRPLEVTYSSPIFQVICTYIYMLLCIRDLRVFN